MMLCDDDCDICYNKSFQSHEKSKYWSNQNQVKPRNVSKGSDKKYLFDCPYCDKPYLAEIKLVVKGVWCICTKNKTETKVYAYLTHKLKLVVDRPKSFPWCKNKRRLLFDMYIKEYNVILEIDGPHHFQQVWNWKDPKENQKIDEFKMIKANEHNISVIRIDQVDVCMNRNDWENKLKEAIKNYNNPTNIFIGNIYIDWPVTQSFNNNLFY